MLREKIANKAMRFLCKDIAIPDRFAYVDGSAVEGWCAVRFGVEERVLAGFCGNVTTHRVMFPRRVQVDAAMRLA
jgi:hypothetical protein